VDTTALTSPAPIAAGIERARAADTDPAKVRALAEQFEAMLLSQMLRDMKESMTPEAERGGLGAPIFADTVNTELGLSLSRAGGVGLADVLMRALKAYEAPRDISEVEATAPAITSAPPEETRGTVLALPAPPAALPAPPAALPAPSALALPALPANDGVTSDYGWRTDPIHGQARFHAGVDLRYAYAQEVHAAAAGIVTFSGDKGGYGTTVVIQHSDGLETRYAHLSSADVQVGAKVEAGAVIARSGNSGRSTGPHLHFEVRQDGRAVDPEIFNP
jgi:murein DD-endopeptidase MepM/ murein hydrolase activator NlpD